MRPRSVRARRRASFARSGSCEASAGAVAVRDATLGGNIPCTVRATSGGKLLGTTPTRGDVVYRIGDRRPINVRRNGARDFVRKEPLWRDSGGPETWPPPRRRRLRCGKENLL